MPDGRTSFWRSFPADPRDPAYAGMRASDADRDLVQQALTTAYAEGRLDREEYDERAERAATARTLGELPALVLDLVPTTEVAAVATGDAELRARAERKYRSDLREALGAFLVPSLICLVVWSVTMFGGFFWPAFVMAGTGVHLLQIRLRREDIVEKHVDRLQQKQARELERRRRDEQS